MSTNPGASALFRLCREGNIEAVKQLVEQSEVELNIRDEWDSTPLYYACLCGHEELVKYLLTVGARCDASTFDGERCLYGALTTDIRAILERFKVVSARVRRREPFQEFMRRLFEQSIGSDVTFCVHDKRFKAHKAILTARNAQYFGEMFMGKWSNRDTISITHPKVDCTAFRLVLEYLYTGRMKVPVSAVDEVKAICKQCKIFTLIEDLHRALRKSETFMMSKQGLSIKDLLIESESSTDQVSMDMRAVARYALPCEFWHVVPEAEAGEDWLRDPGDALKVPPFYFDATIQVDDFVFRVHKALLSFRSDYFRALFEDQHRREGNHQARLSNIEPETFASVLSHIYCNEQRVSVEDIQDIMICADMFLLPSLKRSCGIFLQPFLSTDNVVSLVETARMFAIPRLERACEHFMATHIREMCSRNDFRELVLRDARSIRGRQETDTIDIIDEIRFCIKSGSAFRSPSDTDQEDPLKWNSGANLANEQQARLEILEDMLRELGFDV